MRFAQREKAHYFPRLISFRGLDNDPVRQVTESLPPGTEREPGDSGPARVGPLAAYADLVVFSLDRLAFLLNGEDSVRGTLKASSQV